MRQVEGYSLWLGHRGDLGDPQSIVDREFSAVSTSQ